MFVLQQINKGFASLFAITVPSSDGFNYTGDLDEATLFESSNEALVTFAKRVKSHPGISADFELVEVRAVRPVKKLYEIVRVL